MAIAYGILGDYVQEIKSFEKVLEIDPNNELVKKKLEAAKKN
jgi:hypothetical protein